MPELPEVETIVRSLVPHLQGRKVTSVRLLRPKSLDPFSLPLSRLKGLTFTDFQRRGKLILLGLSREQNTPLTLAVHLRMTGALLVAAGKEAGPHTRLLLDLEDKDGKASQLFFDDIRCFGRLLLADTERLLVWPYLRMLGPEPLSLTLPNFTAILRHHSLSRIKPLLLNQHAIAGIGNIYADEGLFRAKILPARTAGTLTAREGAALLKAIKAVLTEAIADLGTSFRNYHDANGQAGAFQNKLLVYGHAGQACPACGNMLTRTRLAGRTTVFCPHCQN